MVERIEVLLSRQTFERTKGLRWLVGASDTPFTVLSILHCTRHSGEGVPDITSEADEIRVLLPRGLEIVGAALDERNGLESAKRAGKFALQLASKLGCTKASGIIAACLKPDSSDMQFYIYKGSSAEGIGTVNDVFYHENSGSKLWKNRHLLRCKMQLQVPVYAKSFSDLTDGSGYKAQLSSTFENILQELKNENIHCLIDGFSDDGKKGKQALVKLNSNGESIHLSDFMSSEFIKSPHGTEVPSPITVSFMLYQSDRSSKVKAPIVEFLPVSGAEARILDLGLDVICVARHDIGLSDAIKSLVLPAISDQLQAMKQTILHEFLEHTKLHSYHFCPPGFIHPVSCIYDVSFGESELKTVEQRRVLHQRLGLPLDRPLLRIATALTFEEAKNTPDTKVQGRSRLSNVHLNLPSGSGVVGGHVSIIQGSYDYYHYLQDNMNDNGWGCAYRSLQTIISWFRLQHYTTVDVPTHNKIQEILVEIGDKEPSFIGSQKWIGAIELSFVLDQLLGVSCKVINVRSGAELPEKCRELALHFETQGTPIMIGGGVLAYTLLGVDYNDATGDCAFLILDPHYTGGEDLKTIWNGGWCGWKKAVSASGEEFFLRNEFYNLLLPQRPNTI